MIFGEGAIPPALFMVAGAALLPLLSRKLRSTAFLLFAFCSLYTACTLPDGAVLSVRFLNYTLLLTKVDALSRVFGIIFALIAFAGGIYAFHIKETAQQSAALLYAGSALGVSFAGDYFTLLVFWELMAVASLYLIWANRTEESRKAGFRYLLVHIFGGGMLFAGILMHLTQTGQIEIGRLIPDGSLSSWLILLGVGLNAAVPPLNAWLPDAYPRATVTGAVFLSAFTTKAAVYALLRIFPGWKVLLIMGVIMTLYGVIFAILSNDIRGILAYHIISQVGYMVAGVGIGTEMSMNGSAAHAFSHILYKALLFMGAGTILQATGRYKLTELGGLGGAMPRTFLLYMVGAFSISGVPLFNGFISKSMVISAAGEAHYGLAVLLLELASVGTFLSVGLKLPFFTWFSKKPTLTPDPPPGNMHIGMAVVSILCVGYGIFPSVLYHILPYPVHYEPYATAHVIEAVELLSFTFIAFWILRKFLKPKSVLLIDFDWFYRKPARLARKIFVDMVFSVFAWTEKVLGLGLQRAVNFGKNPLGFLTGTDSDQAYSPDKYRPATQTLVLIVLAGFIVLAVVGLILLSR
ncbi:MAG: Na(+)/H(+) antiporter subunit D [Candidatus Aminicenantales bacterium]